MALSAAMETALAGDKPAAWMLEIVVAGTTYRSTNLAGYYSAANGYYEGRIISLGSIDERAPSWDGDIAALTMTATMADTDRTWGRIIEGPNGRDVRGSTATLYFGHPEVASSNWYTAFVGEVSRWTWPQPFQITFTLRTSDRPLKAQAPRGSWRITDGDFPDAASNASGAIAPMIYGEQNSELESAEGMVPLLNVATTDYIYMVCAGWAKTIDNVYIDGAIASTSTYSVSHPNIGGRLYTLLTFTSDNSSAAISADMTGYETVGDGSGTLIEDPSTAIAHFVTNFIQGDYRRDDWLSTDAIVASTEFSNAYWAAHGFVAAHYVSGQTRGYDFLAEMAKSVGGGIWWQNDGTLAFGIIDPTSTDGLYGDDWIRWDDDAVSMISRDMDDTVIKSSVTAQWLYDANAGRYQQSITTRETYQDDNDADSFELSWGPAA